MSTILNNPDENENEPPKGWMGQVVDLSLRAIFHPSWEPWVRLIVTSVVLVGLIIAVRRWA